METKIDSSQKQVFYAAVALSKEQLVHLNTDFDASSNGKNPENLQFTLQNVPSFRVHKRKIDPFIWEKNDFMLVTFLGNVNEIEKKFSFDDNYTLKPGTTINEADILSCVPIPANQQQTSISLMQQDTLFGLSYLIAHAFKGHYRGTLVGLLSKDTPISLHQYFLFLEEILYVNKTSFNNRFYNGEESPSRSTPRQPKVGCEPTLVSVMNDIRSVAQVFANYKKDLLKLIANGAIKEGTERLFEVVNQMEQIEKALLISLMNLFEYKQHEQFQNYSLQELQKYLNFIDMATLQSSAPIINFLAQDTLVPNDVVSSAKTSPEPPPVVNTGTSFSSHGEIKEMELSWEEFPESHGIPLTHTDCLVLGDLHGNAIKLIYFLLHENIMTGINKQEYDELVAIYKNNKYSLGDDFQSSIHLLRKKLARFDEIVAKLTPVNKDSIPSVLLAGDVFADRGDNDRYTMSVLKQLKIQKVPTKILYSNHDDVFNNIRENDGFDKFYSTMIWEPSYFTVLGHGQDNSVKQLGNFLRLGVVTKEEISAFIEDVYLPMLTAIELNVDFEKKELISFTHAPVPITIIPKIAQQLNLPCEDEATLFQSPPKVLELVAVINTTLQQLLKEKKLVQYTKEGTALYDLIWARPRNPEWATNPLPEDWSMIHVHGHDGKGNSSKSYPPKISTYDLDNRFGIPGLDRGNYNVFYYGNNPTYIAERTKAIAQRPIDNADVQQGFTTLEKPVVPTKSTSNQPSGIESEVTAQSDEQQTSFKRGGANVTHKIENQRDDKKAVLIEIVAALIFNIQNKENGRWTSGIGSKKVELLERIKNSISRQKEITSDSSQPYLQEIMKICSMRRNPIHFWATPESVQEFVNLLKLHGLLVENTKKNLKL